MEHSAEILQIYNHRHYNQGEAVIRSGTVGDEIFIIQTGIVEVHQGSDDGGEVVKTLYPGDYFGEAALLSDTNVTRINDVVALTELEVIFFYKWDFLRLVRNLQEIAL